MQDDLFEKLEKYHKSGAYPMHMPGHKRNDAMFSLDNPYTMDITEIDGFDNLHHAEELLKESMELAASVFHADRTFYLVNGSTAGILIGIFAATKQGDTVLVARNCHRAVYHAIELRGLKPVYLLPESEQGEAKNQRVVEEQRTAKNRTTLENQKAIGIVGEISTKEVEKELSKHPEISLVILTSPTYEGVISDIEEIAEVTHRAGALLMVDEAHGAHLGFHPMLYKNSNESGADLVVQSVHKTLPAFTQTALLHVNHAGNDGIKTRKDGRKKFCYQQLVTRVEEYSAIFQTSSPSYLLMASIDRCVRFLAAPEGKREMEWYAERLTRFYEETRELKLLSVWRPEGKIRKDPSKIVIVPRKNMTGKQLYDILKDSYCIQPEMAAERYVLCMTSVADTEEGFTRLRNALWEIEKMLEQGDSDSEICNSIPKQNPEELPTQRYSICEAKEFPKKKIPLDQASGEVVAEEIIVYPPGIPTLVPGEKIGWAQIKKLMDAKAQGLTVYGVDEQYNISVIATEETE